LSCSRIKSTESLFGILKNVRTASPAGILATYVFCAEMQLQKNIQDAMAMIVFITF